MIINSAAGSFVSMKDCKNYEVRSLNHDSELFVVAKNNEVPLFVIPISKDRTIGTAIEFSNLDAEMLQNLKNSSKKYSGTCSEIAVVLSDSGFICLVINNNEKESFCLQIKF